MVDWGKGRYGFPEGNLRDPSIIVRMITFHAYLQEPWPFGQMTLPELFDLASAADHVAEPYLKTRDLAEREGLDPKILEGVGRAGGATGTPADAGKPVGVDELEWARALLAELEARRSAVPADTAAYLEDASAKVRRLIELGEEEGR